HSSILLSPIQEPSSTFGGLTLFFSLSISSTARTPISASTSTSASASATIRSPTPFSSGSLVPPVQYPRGEPRSVAFGDNFWILFGNIDGGSLTDLFGEAGERGFVSIKLMFAVYFTSEGL